MGLAPGWGLCCVALSSCADSVHSDAMTAFVFSRVRLSGAFYGCFFAVLCACFFLGCRSRSVVDRAALDDLRSVSSLAAADVDEIFVGLPVGAASLAGRSFSDPLVVRSLLLRIRSAVPALTSAKSTFFALADARGVFIRNDLELDSMAGQSLFGAFPAFGRLSAGVVTTATGLLPGVPSTDRDWVAATPIGGDAGVSGILITGWSYRYFARHLQESLRRQLQRDLAERGESRKMPIVYVSVFDRSGVYSAPTTPDADEKALARLPLPTSAAPGPISGLVTIDSREFGYAAAVVSRLGPDVGIAVLRSEI